MYIIPLEIQKIKIQKQKRFSNMIQLSGQQIQYANQNNSNFWEIANKLNQKINQEILQLNDNIHEMEIVS